MIYLNHDDVHYKVMSGNVNDFHNNLPSIKADIESMRAIHDGSQKWFHRPNRWDIQQVDESTVVTIYGEAKVEEKKLELEKLKQSEARYIPAFHTYDNNGNWKGITLCIKGAWGGPYVFVPCQEGKIYPFAYGQWNTSFGAQPPVDYNLRFITRHFMLGYNTLLYEVPAKHTLITYDGSLDWEVYDNTRTTYIGGYYWVTHCGYGCADPSTDASLEYVRNAIWLWSTRTPLRIMVVDLSIDQQYEDYNTLPYVKESFIYDTQSGNYTRAGASVYVHDPSTNKACALAYAYLMTNYPPASHVWPYDDSFRQNGWSKYDVSEMFTGKSLFQSTALWGTCIGTEVEDCFFFFASTVYDNVGTRWVEADICSEDVSYYTYNSYSSYDAIQVFGKEYILESHSTSYGSAPRKILGLTCVKPRIYEIGDNRIGLASFYRNDHQHFEYVMFSNLVEQYNDEDAKYEYISTSKHMLPVKYNSEQLYGNGKFSFVLMIVLDKEV